MKKKLIISVLSILFLICTTFLYTIAYDYSVRLTRKGQDLYKDENSSIYIQTQYCYEYCNYEEAILKSSGYGYGKIIFKNGNEYDVRGIYNSIKPDYHTMILTKMGTLEEAELILVPTKLR